MKQILTCLTAVSALVSAANAQVVINEVLANPYGSDSSASTGYEFFELRGQANLSLSGYYLLSIEGQGTTLRGDVNQFFDLGAFSLGANGYLFARQNFSPYTTTAPGATVVQNTVSQGWGTAATSTAGHSGDGTQVDLENSATTILLINKGAGAAPTLTLDMDANDDGLLELPAGWTLLDSVGLLDGVSAAATDYSYGAITFRAAIPAGTYLGGSALGNVIDVPGTSPTTAGAFYVARKGESTGSTADDWFGANLSNSSTSPNLAFTTDPFYQGRPISDMVPGGLNPIPEPASLAFFGLGVLGVLLRRKIG